MKRILSKEIHTYAGLMLAAQRALLGEIEGCFRGVAVEWNNNVIILYFYVNGPIMLELREICRSIGTEIVACYSEAEVDEKIIRIDSPSYLPHHNYWVYRKKED